MGGHQIKAIAEETDVIIEGMDEQMVSVFAPSQEAMGEAMEKIDAILNEEIKVGWLIGCYGNAPADFARRPLLVESYMYL
jgi:polyribonucleotide nucleotidyltransferase